MIQTFPPRHDRGPIGADRSGQRLPGVAVDSATGPSVGVAVDSTTGSSVGVVVALVAGVLLAVGLVAGGAMIEQRRVPGSSPAARASTTAAASPVEHALDQKVSLARTLEKVTQSLSFVGLAGTVFVLGVLTFVFVIVPLPPQEAPPLARGDPLALLVRGAALATVVATIAGFFVRVGIESDRGWAGILDRRALGVVLPGPVGASTLFRVGGTLLALAVLVAPARALRLPLSFVHGGLSIIGGLRVEAGAKRRIGAVVAAAVSLTSCVIIGHAQATQPRWLLMAADMAHVTAAAVWFGGVAMLALTMRRARFTHAMPLLGPLADGESLRRRVAVTVGRFSVVAAVSLVTVTVSGTAMAWSQIRSVDALVSTSYGTTLLLKLACVGAVMVVGGYNHQILVPRVLRDEYDEHAWTGLLRAVTVEVTIILGGVLVASVAMAGGGFARWVG